MSEENYLTSQSSSDQRREEQRAKEQAARDAQRAKEEAARARNTKLTKGASEKQAAREAAKEYGIDTKGMSTREIKAAVSNADFVQQKLEDDMAKFIEKTLANFTEKKGGEVAPNDKPAVVASRVTETVAQPIIPSTNPVYTPPTPSSDGIIRAFCRVFQMDEDWYLTGGQVFGGEGNEIVSDINIGSVETPPSNGTHYWLKIGFDATVEDDVLLPGGDVTYVTVGDGTSIPSNKIPTVSEPSGFIYISLGSWSGGQFVPAGCGNIPVCHCPGSLTVYRSCSV